MTISDASIKRRLADLERRLRLLEESLNRLRAKRDRQTQPICGRLWRFTLNENMGATTTQKASADLVDLDGTDTSLDVTVEDLLNKWSSAVTDDAGICLEQIDMDGTLFYVIMECP